MNNLFLFIYRDALALRATRYGHDTPAPLYLLFTDCSGESSNNNEDGWKSGKLEFVVRNVVMSMITNKGLAKQAVQFC